MTVYVDDVRHSFRRMIMCHLWADDVNELHAFAASLGLRREWFQCPPAASWNHYDISLTVKARALAAGAVLTDRYGPSLHVARQRLLAATDASPQAIAILLNNVLRIANARHRFDTNDPREIAEFLEFSRREFIRNCT